MSVQIQYLRGSAAQLNAFTGAQAEIVVNTDDYSLRVLDGATPGGFAVAGLTQTQTLSNKTLASPVISGVLLGTSANLTGSVRANNVFSDNYYFANGTPFQTNYGNANVVALIGSGTIASDYIPAGNATYSLGNSTNQWNDLWVSNATIFMNSIPISLNSGNVLTVNGTNVMPQTSNLNFTTTGLITGNSVTSNNVTTGTINASGNAIIGNVSTSLLSTTNLNVVSGINTSTLTATTITGTLTTPAQPAITSLGTLSSLSVNGVLTATGNIQAGNIYGTLTQGVQVGITQVGPLANLAVTGNITTSANLNAVTAVVTGNISGGNITATGAITSATANISGAVAVGSLTSGGNVSGANVYTNGAFWLSNSQPILTSAGALTVGAISGNSINVGSGNITGGNLVAVNGITWANGATIINTNGNLTGNNISVSGFITANGDITGQYIRGDGGYLTNVQVNFANTAATITANAQPNITSVGNLTTLNVSGTVTATTFYGDGGNLTNINVGNITGVIANANYALNANYASFAGNVTLGPQPNITQVGTLLSLNVTGNVTALAYNGSGAGLTNLNLIGDGYRISNVVGANVTGTVANANYSVFGNASVYSTYANVANTVNDNAQPNITSVGTLTSLAVTGNISTASGIISGDGGGISNIRGAQVTGTVANATYSTQAGQANNANLSLQANNANTAVTVTANAQPNITSVGTLTSLTVAGGINANSVNAPGDSVFGNVLFTGNVTLPGNINQISGNSGSFYGIPPEGFNALYAGIPVGYANLLNTVLEVAANNNEYAQINFQNINSGNAASADFVVTADVGTDNTYYVDLGIASSTFDGFSANTIGNVIKPNDAYLYAEGAGVAGQQGGNLILGASTPGKFVKIIAGGANDGDVVATFDENDININGNINMSSPGNLTTAGNVTGGYFFGNASTLSGNIPQAQSTTNITGGGALTIPYQSAANTTQFVTAPVTTGTFLSYNGSGFAWAAATVSALSTNVSFSNDGLGNTSPASFNGIANVAVSYNTVGAAAANGVNATGTWTINTSGYAGTVSGNAQPNITSIGNLISLTVTGAVTANTFLGSGALLTSVNGANVTGYVLNANNAIQAQQSTIAGTAFRADFILQNNQPNINQVGTLNSLAVIGSTSLTNVVSTSNANLFAIYSDNYYYANGQPVFGNSGTVNAGNIIATGYATYGGNVTAGNITTAGLANVGGLSVVNNVGVGGNLTVNGITTLTNNLIGTSINAATIGNAGTAFTGASISAATIGNAGAILIGTLDATSAAQPNVTSLGTLTGLTVSGDIVPNSNAVVNLGSSGARFNMIYGVASSAQYADLAESYVGDHKYEPGTVVSFGGSKEVTQSTVDGDRRVAGVVSTNPAYLMNSELHDPNTVAVALTGRVPTKVTGPVRKGDLMVSAGDGTARAEEDPKAGSIIGKALADFEGATGTIEVVVGRF